MRSLSVLYEPFSEAARVTGKPHILRKPYTLRRHHALSYLTSTETSHEPGQRLSQRTGLIRDQKWPHFRYALTKSIMSSASSCGGVEFRSGDSRWCRM